MNAPLVPVSVQPDRTRHIGGSDIAGIMGLSQWATPLDVYLHKIGEQQEPITPEKAKLFKRGKRGEPRVVDDLIEDHGVIVTKRSSEEEPNRYLDREHPFMAAEIDFEWDDNGQTENGEAKTVGNFVKHKWGDEGTEDVPIEYACQAMYGLSVTGRRKCLVAAGFGFDVVPYYLRRDDEIIEGMRAKAVSFWTKNVQALVPPDPINMDDMMKLFAKVRGRPVTLDEDTLTLLHTLRSVRQRKKAFEDEEKDIAFRVTDFIRRQWGVEDFSEMPEDDARLLTAEGLELASWKSQSVTRIDVDRLRAEKPDLAAHFSKTSHFRALRFKKRK